ncbi:MAG: protein TolQ [Rickettsiales bacterium]|nr:protein TolQ [Rickettsiales bacterium]
MSASFNLVNLVSEADIIVRFVLFLLFAGSFLSWAIIVDKFIKFKVIETKASLFEKDFWSGKELTELYEKAQSKNTHPLSSVFVNAVNEWQLQNTLDLSDDYAKERLKERVYQTMMVSKSKSINAIESNINFLATIASSAPFIGLFGTVWGIMNSFSAIAGTQNTSLAIVAPGISEALFATAAGLFVAIPALIFYNIFVNKVSAYNSRVEDFSIEMLNLLSRELDKKV